MYENSIDFDADAGTISVAGFSRSEDPKVFPTEVVDAVLSLGYISEFQWNIVKTFRHAQMKDGVVRPHRITTISELVGEDLSGKDVYTWHVDSYDDAGMTLVPCDSVAVASEKYHGNTQYRFVFNEYESLVKDGTDALDEFLNALYEKDDEEANAKLREIDFVEDFLRRDYHSAFTVWVFG